MKEYRKEIIIGLLNDYDEPRLITFDGLKEYIKNRSPIFCLKQYFDWRYNTNLTKFVYDPFTGEKINWDELKKSI